MATPIEEIKVVLDVVNEFSETFSQFLTELTNVRAVAESMDDLTIDVDVRDHELDGLLAKLGATQAGAVGVSGVPSGGSASGDTPTTFAEFGKIGGEMGKQVDTLADLFDEFSLKATDINNAIAKLIPLVVVLIGTLPALITGFVAIGAAALSAAAALAAIGGFGAIGAALARDGDVTAGLGDIFNEIQASFMDAFTPLARELAPLFERGLDGLTKLFDEIAARGDILLGLRDEAIGFGQFVIDYVPDVLAAMGRMADSFAPLFGQLASFLQDVSILEGLSTMMARMLPSFMQFLDLLIQLIPFVINLSIGFMRVANMLGTLLELFLIVANTFPRLTAGLGTLIAGLLTFVTVISIVNSAVVTGLIGSLASFGSSLILNSGLLLGFTTTPVNAIGGLLGFSAATKAAAVGVGILGTALVSLLAITGLGILLPILGGIASKAFGIGDGFDAATSSLQDFKSEARGLRGENPYSAPGDPTDTGTLLGGNRSGRANVSINIEGNADPESTRRAVDSALHRYNKQ
jgi:hypothetical protein